MSNSVSVSSILLIESDPDCSYWQAALLRMWGYRVRPACCARQAFALALAWPPAIVVVEPFLKRGQDGWQVVRRVREMQAIAPRCIAVTTRSRDADYTRSREVGIERHLLKPACPAELRSALAGASSEVSTTGKLVRPVPV